MSRLGRVRVGRIEGVGLEISVFSECGGGGC